MTGLRMRRSVEPGSELQLTVGERVVACAAVLVGRIKQGLSRALAPDEPTEVGEELEQRNHFAVAEHLAAHRATCDVFAFLGSLIVARPWSRAVDWPDLDRQAAREARASRPSSTSAR
jgi:hypothetical protein